MRYLIIAIIALVFLPSTTGISAQEIPELRPSGTVSINVSDFMNVLREFDSMYQQRQLGQKFTDTRWISMAERFDRFTAKDIIQDRKQYGQFILRARLIQGECYLFASMVAYKSSPDGDRFFNYYHKGISLLNDVIKVASDNIDWLPRYGLLASIDDRNPNYVNLHEYAGCETIGTGLQAVQAIGEHKAPLRSVSWDVSDYASLDILKNYIEICHGEMSESERGIYISKIQQNEEPYYNLKQVRTSDKARELLHDFCPWGVELYFFLQNDTNLAGSLDFKILEPYGGNETLKLCEGSINGSIPLHISEHALKLIGSGIASSDSTTSKATGINWIKGSKGLVNRMGGDVEIKWDVVQESPTCSIIYMSPTCYGLKVTDLLTWALRAVKLYEGGLAGLAADEVIGTLLNQVTNMYGENSDISVVSTLVVDGNNYGLVDSGVMLKGDSYNPLNLLREMVKASFAYAEEKEIEWLFEGIDPSVSLMGTSYDGSPIPPVIIRTEVYGFEDVPDTKYRRTHRFINFYQLDPSYLVFNEQSGSYDLSKRYVTDVYNAESYLAGNRETQTRTLAPMLNRPGKPVGSRQYVTDFTPIMQMIDLALDKSRYDDYFNSGGKKLTVELYSPSNADSPILTYEPLTSAIELSIVNEKRYEELIGTLRPQKNNVITEMFTEYTIKLRSGDSVIETISVNFSGRKDKPASGVITSPQPGIVRIKQESKKTGFEPVTFKGKLKFTRSHEPTWDIKVSFLENGMAKGDISWDIKDSNVQLKIRGGFNLKYNIRVANRNYTIVEFEGSGEYIEEGWYDYPPPDDHMVDTVPFTVEGSYFLEDNPPQLWIKLECNRWSMTSQRLEVE